MKPPKLCVLNLNIDTISKKEAIGIHQLVSIDDQMIRSKLNIILKQKPQESEAAVNIGQVELVDQRSGGLFCLATRWLGKNEFLPSVSIYIYFIE